MITGTRISGENLFVKWWEINVYLATCDFQCTFQGQLLYTNFIQCKFYETSMYYLPDRNTVLFDTI